MYEVYNTLSLDLFHQFMSWDMRLIWVVNILILALHSLFMKLFLYYEFVGFQMIEL